MRTKTGNLRTGDFLSRISFMKVENFSFKFLDTGWGNVEVKNEDGLMWTIQDSIVADECYSTYFDTEEKISKTAAAKMLSHARDAIVQVCFHKQATADTIKDQLVELSTMASAAAKKKLTSLLKGEERIMTGYVIASEPLLGRTVMIDLEKPKDIDDKGWDRRQRQVDHRTIRWIVYKNVKYIVK
jgi:hypothetical protein